MSTAGLAAHEVRKAVTGLLRHTAPTGGPVLLAVSGGADSLALAAATASVAESGGWQPVAAIVDHQLQPGSAEVAAQAQADCQRLGIVDSVVHRVSVQEVGEGLEAAARTARYAALQQAAGAAGASGILLAHTADDQAETVLMRLARGSGVRSIAGMAFVTTPPSPLRPLWRPLLGMERATVRESLAHYGLAPHEDPHNSDPRFLRARVRQQLMPVLYDVLGQQAHLGLVRTAELARLDADALDAIARNVLQLAMVDGELSIDALRSEPPAVVTRVVRSWLLGHGLEGDALNFGRVTSVARLVVDNSITGPIALADGFDVWRESGRLRASRRTDGSSR